MTLIEIFCRNLRLILTLKGESYASLAKLCQGKISVATITNMQNPNKTNPTLNVIATVAEALHIAPKFLLDPNLEYTGYTKPVDGYLRRECLLSDVQNERVKRWEEINATKIRQLKQAKIEKAIRDSDKFKKY